MCRLRLVEAFYNILVLILDWNLNTFYIRLVKFIGFRRIMKSFWSYINFSLMRTSMYLFIKTNVLDNLYKYIHNLIITSYAHGTWEI